MKYNEEIKFKKGLNIILENYVPVIEVCINPKNNIKNFNIVISLDF